MKRFSILFLTFIVCINLFGCAQPLSGEILATTLPVYEFTKIICKDTGLTVTQLISENVSCLHDYTLQVSQMQAIENASVIVSSGAGLEDFLTDVLSGAQKIVDASTGISLLCGFHDHEAHEHAHTDEYDPHIWLSVANAKQMAYNIYLELSAQYPQYQTLFEKNLADLNAEFSQLDQYASSALSNLSQTQLITFHDGFCYLADSYGLEIIHAVEEESGSEASAQELIALIELVKEYNLQAIFTEEYGSSSAASVISAETGVPIYTLDMAISGDSYFDAMYHNINTLKEALQ